MSYIRPNFGPKLLRFTRIVYNCDVNNKDSQRIPLGIMADIVAGNTYGLGLIARKHITEQEANLVGALLRPMVREPFNMLSREFNRLWENHDKGDQFSYLPTASQSSIEFGILNIKDIEVPTSLLTHVSDSDALKLWCRDQLGAELRNEFWSLVTESWFGEPADRDERLEAA